MKTFWLLPVAGTAAALADPSILTPDFVPPHGAIKFSRQELHENTIKSFPSEFIMNTTVLEEYLMAHRDANHTIYLSDEQAFVSLATVEYNVEHPVAHNSSSLASREGGPCIAPAKYTKTYTKQAQQFPGGWSPASGCLYGQKSDAGGSQNLQVSYSIAVQENAGLSWTLIKDVLSATLGLQVTETYSTSRTYTCNMNKKSVVQVWAQPYIAWGWFWSQTCTTFSACGGCAPEYVNGGATAPALNPNTHQWLNYGCSTGVSNVKC